MSLNQSRFLYIAADLRSFVLDTSYTALEPEPIMWTVFAGSPNVARVHKLTPILYAALEIHTDVLDRAAIAGKLNGDQVITISSRLGDIRAFANISLDWNLISEARRVLDGRPDALAWVIAKYVEKMGGESEVMELERSAKLDPWHDTVPNESFMQV